MRQLRFSNGLAASLESCEICNRRATPKLVSNAHSHSRNAGIAQLVEQLICNQQVIGSNPIAGSNLKMELSIFVSL